MISFAICLVVLIEEYTRLLLCLDLDHEHVLMVTMTLLKEYDRAGLNSALEQQPSIPILFYQSVTVHKAFGCHDDIREPGIDLSFRPCISCLFYSVVC